jgi:hypothetical protein
MHSDTVSAFGRYGEKEIVLELGGAMGSTRPTAATLFAVDNDAARVGVLAR